MQLLSLLSSVWFLYSVRTSTCHPPCCCVQACWSVCVCASGIASISSPACQSFDFPLARLVIETGPEPGGALLFASMQMRRLQTRAFACAHLDLSGSGGPLRGPSEAGPLGRLGCRRGPGRSLLLSRCIHSHSRKAAVFCGGAELLGGCRSCFSSGAKRRLARAGPTCQME